MIRILLDQELPRTTASGLQAPGWDVLHTGDIGLSRSKDLEILEYARINKRTVITLDADFHAFLAVANASSPSVIRVRIEGLKAVNMVKLIHDVWPMIEKPIHQGAMVTITEGSVIIHELPVLKQDTKI